MVIMIGAALKGINSIKYRVAIKYKIRFRTRTGFGYKLLDNIIFDESE